MANVLNLQTADTVEAPRETKTSSRSWTACGGNSNNSWAFCG